MYMVYTRKYHGLIDQLLHLFVYCHSLEQLSWERQDWAFTLIILGLIDPVCLCHLTGSFPSPCGITHHFVPVAIATDHWSTPHPRYWLIKMQLMESVLFYKRNRPPYLLAHHFSPICSVKEDKKITSNEHHCQTESNEQQSKGWFNETLRFQQARLCVSISYSKGMSESKCCTVREGHCGQVYLLKGSDNYCRKGATAYPEEQNLCSLLSKNRRNPRQRGLLFLEVFIQFTS